MDIDDIEVVQLAHQTTCVGGRLEIFGLGDPLRVFQDVLCGEMRFLYMSQFYSLPDLVKILFPGDITNKTLFKLRYG